MMEKEIRKRLLSRGFSNKTILNNGGLIGATIDETISMMQSLTVTDSEIEAEFERQLDEHDVSHEPDNNQGDWIDDNYSRVLRVVKGLVYQLTNK